MHCRNPQLATAGLSPDLTASDKAVGGAGYEAIQPKPLPAADFEAAYI